MQWEVKEEVKNLAKIEKVFAIKNNSTKFYFQSITKTQKIICNYLQIITNQQINPHRCERILYLQI